MIVHIVDGTYELFRHFYGQRRFNKGNDAPLGAAGGVLKSVLEIVEQGEPYIGVVGDRVVQVDRKDKAIRDAGAVKVKFDVEPVLIPD